LVARLWKGLTATDGVTCYGPPPGSPRTPTICYSVAGVPSKEVATRLVHDGIFASNGGFYAQDVIQKLGFTGVGLVRAGSACYTTEEEIDRLIEGTRAIALSARRH
jgi:selenocysteine lyase/cysteine desulfurase